MLRCFLSEAAATHQALMLPAVVALSGEISRLRERMRGQKNDLAVALDRIGKLAVRDELTGLYQENPCGAELRKRVLRGALVEPRARHAYL